MQNDAIVFPHLLNLHFVIAAQLPLKRILNLFGTSDSAQEQECGSHDLPGCLLGGL